MTKPIIVGVDIGTTTGLAVYDLNRNLIYTGSKRNVSIDSLIREIGFLGKPIIIATDKKKVPQPVAKIAASFNCRVFSPDHDLTVEEKDEIVRIPIKDVHEKDALSAATSAFKSFAAQFNNIDRNLESMGLSQLKDRVKEMIVSRDAKNISEAVERLKPKEENAVETQNVGKEVFLNWREKAKELESELKEERRRNDILKNYSEKLSDKVNELERQKQLYIEEEMKKNDDARKCVLKDREIKKRDILIKQMQFELSKQKNLKNAFEENLKVQEEAKDIINKGLIPVVVLPEFTKESISQSHRRFDLRGKVVWIKSFKPSKPSAVFMASLGPKVVIGELDDESKEILGKNNVIVIESAKLQQRKYFAAISPQSVESDVKRTERKNFTDWLADYRKRTT
jgi:predicted RNase H-like nuclease (RuvC/YqgF family)